MHLKLNRLLDVTTIDLEDARRRRLLNILIASMGILSLTVIVTTVVVQALHWVASTEAFFQIYVVGSCVFLACIAIYAVNRYISGTVASVAFLALWLIVLPLIDLPDEVVSGRALFAFTIPIIISSVLLKPRAAFILAGLSGLEIIALALFIHVVPNFPALLGFLLIALISWLSARSLETALHAVVTVNRELDQHVIERTMALSEALVRERAEASRSKAILEGIADGVVVFDRGGNIMMANPAIELFPGVASWPLGQSLKDWLLQSPLDQPDRDSIQELMTNQLYQDGYCKVQWGPKTLAVSVAPVRTSGGELIGRVAVFHDFTREAELDRLKNDFLAMVSHELRTPLNSVLGYSDMLREGIYGKLVDRQINIVERIIANTHKLLSIVNDLLDQAQIEAGRLSFRNRPFRPTDLLDYMQGVMGGILQSKNLELVTEISPELPKTLYGDPQRLNQVLMNLVNNAVKFTEVGQIKVRLSLADQDHWSMEVSDTGIGIPSEAQQFIFDPFRQVDADVTNRPGGIGLGLSIVKRLVELMQGEICVKSQEGGGSTFTVILPLEISDME